MPLRADRPEERHGTTERRAHEGPRRLACGAEPAEPLFVRGALGAAATAGERTRRSIGDLFVEEHTICVRFAGIFQCRITRARRARWIGADACVRARLGRCLGGRGAGRRGGRGLGSRGALRGGLQWPRDLGRRITRRKPTEREDGHRPRGSYGPRSERLHRVPTTFKSSIWRWNPAPETAPGKYNRPVSE